MHELLERQLQSAFGPEAKLTPELQAFVAAVDAAYRAADQDCARLERALDLTAKELLARNEGLRRHLADVELAHSLLLERARLNALETEIERILIRGGALDETLRACVESIVSHLEASSAHVWTLDERRQLLVLQASAGLADPLEGDYREVPLGSRLEIGRVAALRTPRYSNDVHNDLEGGDRERARREGIVAFGCFPLLAGDRLLGVVAIGRRQPLSEFTLVALGSIAASIALGIENRRSQSERERLEERLRQTQKMEAIGRLAGGIAHDFNNLLTAISGYAGLAAGQLAVGSRVAGHVEEIRRAAERAARLTRQLLAFSRQQVMQPAVLDLNVLLGEMQGMLRSLIREDIELVFAPQPDLGRVLADPSQLEQVLMNLVVNARDAMPRGGRLTLATANVRLEGSEGGPGFAILPGDYVRLTVRDTGTGMDEATLSRVFEPFFTTKEKGKGTGLGLANVYGVIKQSGGYVWPESQPGLGACLYVFLPRVEQPAQTASAAPLAPAPRTGGETVLLAEDEEAVRSLVVTILSARGYRVLPAASGREALALCHATAEPVDLLLTDVVMPEMSGRELARRLALLHPEAKVLFMSGDTDHSLEDKGTLEAGVSLLEKPFLPSALVQRVRELLDRNR